MSRLAISFDSDLLEQIASDFDLRAPNKEALRQLIFTLDGDYDPSVMQVLNLATGVGKTYLMAAFIEYLRRQGVGNVVIVTPGKTVQAKTVNNFAPGSPRYIAGSPVPPEVVTPQDYSAWISRQNGAEMLSFGREKPVLAFIFNIQQLIAPKSEDGETQGSGADAQRRKPRRFDENAGVLFDYLKGLDDLVVIADESHLYGASAVAFSAALKELDPAATIGLTASVNATDHVIYTYPLYRAISDRFVKAPVLAFRKAGYDATPASEEQQLRDALALRAIKQAHYDAYTQANNQSSLNAVAFVVCSDVDHATQVAELLRTPEFLGREDAVLQVDTKHDDEVTQRRLNELDAPHSTVLAVVSVNKLKEGWDVKNVAVVVTLRAMASEVLTQQTMGRGLRLPFGRYTGVGQIDQLDIIAHQSFTELLAAENVLQQFGLEDTTTADPAAVQRAIRDAGQPEPPQPSEGMTTTGPDASATGPARPTDQTPGVVPVENPEEGDSQPGLGVRSLDSDLEDEATDPVELVTIERNPVFAEVEYWFPVTRVSVQQPPIDLSDIHDDQIRAAAQRVTRTGDVLLRKEIVATLGKRLRVEDRESAEVESIHLETSDVELALNKLVVGMGMVPKTDPTIRYVARYLVPTFMKHVTFTEWTVKSLASAENELRTLVHGYIVETLRSTREVPSIHPKREPGNGYTLPLGEQVHDQIQDRSQFVRGRVYGGWSKSLFAEESFDSYTGEYLLARLLNTSPHIVWWHRLHPQDQAFVYYTSKDRYFPDFVALDDQGVYWIIEGKDERGRDNEKVLAKRKAAEALVRRLVADDHFADQNWGYLIAYEADTQRADSWDDLKAYSAPVTNEV